jgi:ATP-dependent Clp protease ATP-binding subunit ClpA
MFEKYSDRARRVIFLSRKIAGQRGAAEIGVEDLMESLVVEDQGDFVKAFSREMAGGAAVQRIGKHQPFFGAEAAAAIHGGLEPLLASNGKPLPTSVDMPVSTDLKRVLERAKELSEEMRHQPDTPTHLHAGHVEPLHLLAAVLADETSEVAKIVKQAGVERAAVIAAIRSGEYSK